MVRLWGYQYKKLQCDGDDACRIKTKDNSDHEKSNMFRRKKILYAKLVDIPATPSSTRTPTSTRTPAASASATSISRCQQNTKLPSSSAGAQPSCGTPNTTVTHVADTRDDRVNCAQHHGIVHHHRRHSHQRITSDSRGTARAKTPAQSTATDAAAAAAVVAIVRDAHYAQKCYITSPPHNPAASSPTRTSVAAQHQPPPRAATTGNNQQQATGAQHQQHQQQQHQKSVGRIRQRIGQHQRNIRKFMKGLLRQRLDSIAGKVLAVASAAVGSAASPVKKRRPVVVATVDGAVADATAHSTSTVAAAADKRTTNGGNHHDDDGGNGDDDDEDRYVQVQQTLGIVVINNNLGTDEVDHPHRQHNQHSAHTPHHQHHHHHHPRISSSSPPPPLPPSNAVGVVGQSSGADDDDDVEAAQQGKHNDDDDGDHQHQGNGGSIDNLANQFDGGMQDIRLRVERPASNNHHGSPNHQQQQQQQHSPQQHQHHQQTHHPHNNNTAQLAPHLQSPAKPTPQPRPMHLFTNPNLNCDNNQHQPQQNNHLPPHHQQQQQLPNHHHHHHHSNIQSRSPSSEEDNSPTEMNNCRRLIDKPPLVKRLTMGLLRSTEDSRPLVQHNNACSPTSGSTHTISDGYVNEAICDADLKLITAKFGDSCRKSLTSVMDKTMLGGSLGGGGGGGGGGSSGPHDGCEFDFKKNFLRETSSANSSPKIFAPSAPRFDTLEHQELKGAPWFQAGLPREISLEVLSRQSPGAFLVRQSSTKPGCFALSLRVPPPAPKVAHYLILKTARGYKIKGFTKEFTSLRALITHHSVMPELLPIPLALARPQNIIPQRRHPDDFDTYGSLNDFRKMMSDMNV